MGWTLAVSKAAMPNEMVPGANIAVFRSTAVGLEPLRGQGSSANHGRWPPQRDSATGRWRLVDAQRFYGDAGATYGATCVKHGNWPLCTPASSWRSQIITPSSPFAAA
jgi:hypothetical protein